MKAVTLVLCSLLLVGCATTPSIFTQNLSDSESLALLRVNCDGIKIPLLLVERIGEPYQSTKEIQIFSDVSSDYYLCRLPQPGEYVLYTYDQKSSIKAIKRVIIRFQAHENRLTDLGEVEITSNKNNEYQFKLSRSSQGIEALKVKRPDVYQLFSSKVDKIAFK